MLICQGAPKSNVTRRYSVNGQTTSISTTVGLQIAGANPNRQKICFYNASASTTFSIAFGAASSNTDFTTTLKSGDMYEDWNSIDAVYAVISATGSASDILYITEMI